MRFFYDCEFIEDGTTIELVSIGVVDEDGREFYAVSTEFDPTRAIDWVRRNVLDKLPAPADPAWRSLERIRADLLAFLTEPNGSIELWAWMSAYDHVVLAQLWGDMRALPRVIPSVHPRTAPALGGRRLASAAGRAQRPARRARRRPAQPGPLAGHRGRPFEYSARPGRAMTFFGRMRWIASRESANRAMVARSTDFLSLAGSVAVPAARRNASWHDLIRRTRADRAARAK